MNDDFPAPVNPITAMKTSLSLSDVSPWGTSAEDLKKGLNVLDNVRLRPQDHGAPQLRPSVRAVTQAIMQIGVLLRRS